MKRPGLLLFVVVWLLLGTGCSQLLASVELDRAISMSATYAETGGSDVTVTYTVPAPPPGRVYVLWILNPIEGKSARVTVVQPGANRIVKTRVDFEAIGAVVSIETGPTPEDMSNTWIARVGRVSAQDDAERTPIPVGGDAGARRAP